MLRRYCVGRSTEQEAARHTTRDGGELGGDPLCVLVAVVQPGRH
jgi:hypothetical protein